jgi:hypothetical protein
MENIQQSNILNNEAQMSQENNNIYVTNINNSVKITNSIKIVNDNELDNSSDIENADGYKEEPKIKKFMEENQVPSCRICFLSDSDENDPLLTPCKCTGSMSYIHYKCLKQCIQMKTTKKPNGSYVCFLWKNYECEICLQEYPKYLTYKNLTYNMIDFDINFNEYMVLDYTLFDDTKKKSIRKGFIIVDLNNEESLANGNCITIGRTQTNTIKLKDISVSRMHCYFSRENGKFFINDKGSKFGTLVHVKNSQILDKKNSNRTFIAGKHLISVNLLKSKWSMFTSLFSFTDNCCKCKSVDDDEIIFNEKTMNEKNNDLEVFETCEKGLGKLKEPLNDSCSDYVINLKSIIKHNENCNDSFI